MSGTIPVVVVLCVRAADLRLDDLLLGGNRPPLLRDSQMSCVSQPPRFPGRTHGPARRMITAAATMLSWFGKEMVKRHVCPTRSGYITRAFLPVHREIPHSILSLEWPSVARVHGSGGQPKRWLRTLDEALSFS